MSFRPILTDDAWEGLLVVLTSAEFCSLVTTYNIATKQIFLICAGITESNMNRLIHRLENLQGAALHPLLVPVILTTSVVHNIRDFMLKTEYSYLAVAKAMDCVKFYKYDMQYDEAPALTERPQRLTELAADIARGDFANSHIAHVLAHLENLIKMLLKTYPCTVGIELQEELVFMRQRIVSMQHWYHHLRDGVQALVQLVYAMSQQEDNKINHRYGADMRLITAITLIFLPGTFVATFFSSSFWDFAPNNTGSKVSGWVWIYCVVTIVLTLMVLVVWRFFSVLSQVVESGKGWWHVAVSSLKKIPRSREKKKVDEEAGGKVA
ncbi:Nn.00g085500.m01.CDS01 [Neocucurbitaria sp. VM-36]